MTRLKFDILGIGTIAVDDLYHVQQFPPLDGKVPVLGRDRQMGGYRRPEDHRVRVGQ